MRIAPFGRHSIVSEGREGFQVVIPATRSAVTIVFLCAWLVGWYFGETSAAREVLKPDQGAAKLFLLGWLIMWTVGGGWAVYVLLWMVVGTEIVSLHSGTLTLRNDVLGF